MVHSRLSPDFLVFHFRNSSRSLFANFDSSASSFLAISAFLSAMNSLLHSRKFSLVICVPRVLSNSFYLSCYVSVNEKLHIYAPQFQLVSYQILLAPSFVPSLEPIGKDHPLEHWLGRILMAYLDFLDPVLHNQVDSLI